MRDSISGLQRLFARVPTPYVSRYDGSVGGFLGGFGGRSKRDELNAYAHTGTLFAIVSNLALGVSNAEWHLYRKKTDQRRRIGPAPAERTEILSHQALTVWNRPNPFMWQQTFVERVQQQVDLTGLGYVALVRPAGELSGVTEMWPVRSDRLQPVPDREEFLAGWVYTSPDGEQVPLEAHEVLALQMPDPNDVYDGIGPVAAIGTDVEAQRAAAEWNRNFFRNSALPGGLIEVDHSLTDAQFKSLNQRWRESHKGVNNAHRVGILEQGKWKDRSVSQKDMEFVQLRTMSRDVIREAFSYPEFLLGDMGDANRASAYAAEFVEARRLLNPRLKRWRGALNHVFLPLFGATADGLEFDFDSVEPDDEEASTAITVQRVGALVQLLTAGADPEQACELVGLPPIEFDPPAPPPQLVPVPPPAPDPAELDDPEAPPEPTGDPADPDAAIAARARAILQRNGLAAGILNGHAHTVRGRRR